MGITNPARLSIGLPVYNGERFLRFALDSILGQTFADFELIISDNASTDSTKAICQAYAARDPRIYYHRNYENIGAAANFNHVFKMAHSEYFKWAAADDIISPTYLERCVSVLDNDPSIILSYSKVDRIDSSGQVDGVYDYPMRVDAPDAVTRFTDLILVNHFCVAVFGVARQEVLAQTPLIAPYVGSDRVLLAELGLRGRLFEIPEFLFHRRDHAQASGRMFNIYNRLAWFDPSKKRHLNLVYTRVGIEYIQAVQRVSLPGVKKAACYRSIARWFYRRRKYLVEDIKANIIQVAPFSKNLVQFARKRQNKKMNSRGGI